MDSQEIPVTINGKSVKARESMTILEVAKENGIYIPTLCYSEELPCPIGSCRICVVEVEGSRTLVASCHTPIRPNMVIYTNSPKVLRTRKMIVELLLASHVDNCHVCDKANTCELRKIASELGIGFSRFDGSKRFYQIEELNPNIVRDLTKCILCRRCLYVGEEEPFSVAYRGFDSKIVFGDDKSLEDKDIGEDCDIYVNICPVGALVKKEDRFRKKESTPLIITD